MRRIMFSALLTLLMSTAGGSALAADAPSAADIVAIRGFTLNDTFLQHYPVASDDIAGELKGTWPIKFGRCPADQDLARLNCPRPLF